MYYGTHPSSCTARGLRDSLDRFLAYSSSIFILEQTETDIGQNFSEKKHFLNLKLLFRVHQREKAKSFQPTAKAEIVKMADYSYDLPHASTVPLYLSKII